MPSELHAFIKEALAKKATKPEITRALLQAGWQQDEIRSALAAFAEVDFPVPVPKRKPYLSAREAFLYLVMFLCLYLSSFSFGSLLFDFINHWLPDPLQNYYDASRRSLRLSISMLMIAFPLYLWLAMILTRGIYRDPEKKGSKIRKWLTYLTLFIAAGIIIGDLITLLFNLLGGELTVRFLLKVLTVLAIAGTIFGYYLWHFRKEEKEQ